jgi:hypothetical protein
MALFFLSSVDKEKKSRVRQKKILCGAETGFDWLGGFQTRFICGEKKKNITRWKKRKIKKKCLQNLHFCVYTLFFFS